MSLRSEAQQARRGQQPANPASQAADALSRRQQAYKHCLGEKNVAVVTVLADLAKFCHAFETTYTDIERQSAVLEGRRQVYLRILNHLEMELETLWKLYQDGRRIWE